jgi:hypothetical protein
VSDTVFGLSRSPGSYYNEGQSLNLQRLDQDLDLMQGRFEYIDNFKALLDQTWVGLTKPHLDQSRLQWDQRHLGLYTDHCLDHYSK